MIKQSVIGSLQRYVEHGIPTGGFLRAVLENNLTEAFGRADIENREAMFEIVHHVYNNLPYGCHGSAEIVDAWLAAKAEGTA